MKQGNRIGRKLLALVLALSFLTVPPVYANPQIPVAAVDIKNVFYQLSTDVISGETQIRPSILLKWKDPQDWAPAYGLEFDQVYHVPKGYRVKLENISLGNQKTYPFPYVPAPEHESEVSEHVNLETGSVYKLSVRPYHEHINPITGEIKEAPYTGADPFVYAVTDLNVKLESTDSSIAVIWDDIKVKDAKYRIVYALGDYSKEGASKNFFNNKEGEVKDLSEDAAGVTRFFDTVSRRHKLKYELKEKIYPGQIYSVMVEPTLEFYEGKKLHRNHNFPLLHSVSTNVRLQYSPEGENLRLQWKIPATFQVGKDKATYSLATTHLIEIVDGSERNIAVFHKDAGAVNYYLVKKPEGETSYQLKLLYKAGSGKAPIQAVSNVLSYSPTELRITPTKPMVPKLTTPEMIEELKAKNYTAAEIKTKLEKDGHFLDAFEYNGDLADIFNQKAVFHLNKKANSIHLLWSAFRRKNIDISSDGYNKIMTDLNTYYDIAITEDYNALAEVPLLEKDLRFSAAAGDELRKNAKGEIIGFGKDFQQFYHSKTKKLSPFKPNQIYYIKLVAKKKFGQEELKSDPTIVSFYYDEFGVYAPPVMTKPPLRELKDKTSDENVTIGWLERWYEVSDMKSGANAKWHPVMWMKGDEVSSVELENGIKYEIYKSEGEKNKFLKAVKDNPRYHFIAREVDMGKNAYANSGIGYQFTYLPYPDVLQGIEQKRQILGQPDYGFLEYFEDLIEQDKKGLTPLAWQEIQPQKNKDNLLELLHTQTGLKANSSYLFILYPYRKAAEGEKVLAHFPTPIIVSTKPVADVLEPDPTVPRLFVIDSTDTTIEVAWHYNKDFGYQLKYQPLVAEGKEVVLPVEVSADPTQQNYAKDGEFFYFTIPNLFPDTSYQISIQAEHQATQKQSDWSNPITGRTKPILPPPAPPGFGIASLKDLAIYKYDKAIAKDYFTLQWKQLNEDNQANLENKDFSKSYEYLVEVADNDRFIDPLIINTSSGKAGTAEILNKTLVKINGLVAGKTYYARAKTRLTVKSGNLTLVVDSADYTNVVRVRVGIDSEEYDGNRDPKYEVLPDRDFELIYDEKEKSLTHRFRYDQKDANGKPDNRVDQRLINSLLGKGTYTYTVDLNRFSNKKVELRRLEIPYPVYQAFLKHKVTLEVLADSLELKIPAKAIEKEVRAHVQGRADMPFIRLELKEINNQPLAANQQMKSISQAQRLKLEIVSKQKRDKLSYLTEAISIGLRPLSRFEAYQKSPIAYLQNAEQNVRAVDGKYEKLNNLYQIKTADIGSYGLYSPLPAETLKPHWSENYRRKILSRMAIRGLDHYQPEASIDGQSFYNGVYAAVRQEKEMNLLGEIAGEKKRTLIHSGLLLSGIDLEAKMTRIQAFSAFVRLYEMQQEEKINYNRKQVEAIAKTQKISREEAVILLKAEEAGLLSNIATANPQKTLKYGEYFTLLTKAMDW